LVCYCSIRRVTLLYRRRNYRRIYIRFIVEAKK
jgi:hypothetical protein